MTDFFTSFAIQLLLAAILDAAFGELRFGDNSRWHPLVLFGNLARRLERFFYPPSHDIEALENRYPPGVLAVLCAIVPLVFITWLLTLIPVAGWFIEVLLLYLVIGGNSLAEHARNVSQPLFRGDIKEARTKVSWLVSRGTDQLPKEQVVRATVESVLENGNDAVFGALFWFLLAGAPGAVLYRLANTLDAMWGYKNDKYLFFGRFAARLDDVLNWIPARLTALSYLLQGDRSAGLRCWISQARSYKSRNGGAVIAAGAGALGFTLGGAAVYDGEILKGPTLGLGQPAQTVDIERAIALVNRGTWYWVLVSILLALLQPALLPLI